MSGADVKYERIMREVGLCLFDMLQLYPPYNSTHEGYAVVLEELDELWDEVKKKPRDRDREALRVEAIQVAACAARFAAELTSSPTDGGSA